MCQSSMEERGNRVEPFFRLSKALSTRGSDSVEDRIFWARARSRAWMTTGSRQIDVSWLSRVVSTWSCLDSASAGAILDGTLHPCQDYRYLNSHTIRNAYPLPLIPELIDDMKESTLFTKFDICWGYNNIRIREEDQWKAAFITPMGLFKPTVMFFGFCNAPPTFQAFMNHIFADMIREKWLKIYMDDLGIHTKDDLSLHHK